MDRCPAERWWAHQDSNLEPTGYGPGALPLSYRPFRGPLGRGRSLIYYISAGPRNLPLRRILSGPGERIAGLLRGWRLGTARNDSAAPG